MYNYKNNDEEKIICPEYEREVSYCESDDKSKKNFPFKKEKKLSECDKTYKK